MAETNRPMTLEELARLQSVPDRANPPQELSRSQVFLSATSGSNLAAQLKGGSGEPVVTLKPAQSLGGRPVSGWELPSGIYTYGLNVQTAELAQLPASEDETPDHLDAYTPEWSGIDYFPKLAEPISLHTVHRLRRRSGRLVRPEYIFGPDNRVVYYPSGYPWRCIGRIFVWTNSANVNSSWSGTAALVWKNTVLTCSHMAPWASVSSGTPWKALFVAGYYDGSSVNGSGASAWVTGLWGYKNHSQGDDMAVMALNSPLGDWLGYFGYKTYTDAWEDGPWWTLCGYPGMVANAQRPSRQSSFPIQDDDNDGAGVELEYEADTSDGNSGGPVFGWWDGKPYIIGTHSGGEEEAFDTNNVAAGGAALSNLIHWARTHW
jgi:V8-like Glu-specific endopeptidase